MTGKALLLAAGIVLTGPGLRVAADDLPVYRGSAEVVGPAMLSVSGKRILLYGVDAPVKGQPCSAGGKTWERRVDRFGRVFAVCKAGEIDLNRGLVEAGMAVALPKETTDYVGAEAAAKSKGIGIWRGPFATPAEYREMLTGHPQER
jgi:endonuclease YncB( thermonuclease family)